MSHVSRVNRTGQCNVNRVNRSAAPPSPPPPEKIPQQQIRCFGVDKVTKNNLRETKKCEAEFLLRCTIMVRVLFYGGLHVELWPLQVFSFPLFCKVTMIARDSATNDNRPSQQFAGISDLLRLVLLHEGRESNRT